MGTQVGLLGKSPESLCVWKFQRIVIWRLVLVDLPEDGRRVIGSLGLRLLFVFQKAQVVIAWDLLARVLEKSSQLERTASQ